MVSAKLFYVCFALCINYTLQRNQGIVNRLSNFHRFERQSGRNDFVYPGYNGQTPTEVSKLSMSQQKCQEYKKKVTEVVGILPLLPFENPIHVEVPKCDYSSLPLIVGGMPAQAREFPHMAAVGFPNGRHGVDWNCGGTLISDRFVLTAAHCTSTRSGDTPSVVRLGELNLKSDNDGAQPVDYNVMDVITHPDYNPPKYYNDIALLRLEKTVQFNDFIRPACLWTEPELATTKVVATGWGRIDYAEDPSDDLLKVVLSIIDTNTCKQRYSSKDSKLPLGLTSSMMCAGELNGTKDTCQGDSGGPITVSNPQNNCLFYVVGVTSFGKACGLANSPGVYTRVSYFVPWIEKVIWG